MRHVEVDLRKYEVEKTKNILIGPAVVVFCDAKNAWIAVGGKKMHKKQDAEKYAVKLSNLIISLRGE